MRTTVNIDEHLLVEAKLIAARTHRTMGSVLDEALRTFIDEQSRRGDVPSYALPEFTDARPGLRPGVDLQDKEQLADILRDDAHVLP